MVVRACDDEERVGHVLSRIAQHLRSLERSFELLVADEGSGDNTLAVATLLRPTCAEIEILHAEPEEGYRDACARARGRAILLYDARSEAPLAPLGFALERLSEGLDVVAVDGTFLVLRRTRAWRAFDALVDKRDPRQLERRFLRRARSLGLKCEVTHRRPSRWRKLRATLLAPLAFARS